ncbi:DUF1735 domain-containing protein [Bacteroides sp.]|uniref:BT_3987 domain-containing protein n=1 Tax=Bacteroides sp. TaxID=29523 RepID=UPI002FC8CC12
MRKIIYLLVGFLALASCQNELYKDPTETYRSGSGIYIASKGVLQYFVAEGNNLEMTDLKISLAQKTDQLVKTMIEAGNQAQLDDYNKKNGTTYIMLPKEMYELTSNITFEPQYTTIPVPILLKNIQFSLEGTYALPIKLKGGDVAPIGGQDETLIVFEQKIVTKALKVNGAWISGKTMFPNDFKTDQWTLEIMVNRSNYRSRNRAVLGTHTDVNHDAIFVRFGDVTINPNQLQIVTGSSQVDVAADKFSALPNVWYLLTFVYDGKNTLVYVNGDLVAEREIRTGFYGMTGIWLSELNELVREVRLWKVARTALEISANTWKMVNPDDENLIAYFPMNGKKRDRATNTIMPDETQIWDWSKNEHHLQLPNNSSFDGGKDGGFVFPPTAN